MLEQAVSDIFDINGPLLHILIVEQIEHSDKMIDCFLNSYLSRFILTFNNAAYFTHEYRIIQNRQVGIKDTRFLRTHDLTEFFFNKFDLIFRGADAFV
ncbi:hypothetical protein D3C81_1569070 [compost metagenome]